LWAPGSLAGLGLDARIELVRQLGEAIAHAHSRKVTHRALTARSVLVRPSRGAGGLPQLVIGHWQAGARDLLDLLDEALDELTRPPSAEPQPAAGTVVDPLTAHQGDLLDGDWRVAGAFLVLQRGS
jgi:hypothetical protein